MVGKMTVGHATPLGNNPFGKTINEVIKNQTCSECEPFAISTIEKCTKPNCMYKTEKVEKMTKKNSNTLNFLNILLELIMLLLKLRLMVSLSIMKISKILTGKK